MIAGERTREDVHAWSAPWVEGRADVGPPRDLMVGTGLQYLHGLDMTFDQSEPAGPMALDSVYRPIDVDAAAITGPGVLVHDDGAPSRAAADWASVTAAIDHGGPGGYLLTPAQVRERFEHWLDLCRDYDADPAGFRRRRGDRPQDPSQSASGLTKSTPIRDGRHERAPRKARTDRNHP